MAALQQGIARPSAPYPGSKWHVRALANNIFELDRVVLELPKLLPPLLLAGFTSNPLILSKDKVPCTLASFRMLIETVSSS
jgi:hypothetical protein